MKELLPIADCALWTDAKPVDAWRAHGNRHALIHDSLFSQNLLTPDPAQKKGLAS